jgi:hypothetical protein
MNAQAASNAHTDVAGGSTAFIQRAEGAAFLATLPPASVDLIVTEPPTSFRDEATLEAFVESWLPLALSRVRPTGRLYIAVGAFAPEAPCYLRLLLQQRAFVLANVLGWIRPLSEVPGYPLTWKVMLDVRGCHAVDTNERGDIEVFGRSSLGFLPPSTLEFGEGIVDASTVVGDTVVDPFARQGTFLLAAARIGRVALGAESSERNFVTALRRGCRKLG